MLRDSSILVDLERHAFTPAGHPLYIYGDPAYPLRIHWQAPFRDAVLTDDMAAFNASMSSVRVSVEWLFGDIVRSFKFLDFKNNLKIGLSAIGKMYVVCALIRNALTCLYGNQTSDYFGIDPPYNSTIFLVNSATQYLGTDHFLFILLDHVNIPMTPPPFISSPLPQIMTVILS